MDTRPARPQVVLDPSARPLEALVEQAEAHRVLVVTGPVGYGKTALLRRWAAEAGRAGDARLATCAASVEAVLDALLELSGADPPSNPSRLVTAAPDGDHLSDAGREALGSALGALPGATWVLDVQGTHQPLPVLVGLAQLWLDDPAMARHRLIVASRGRPPQGLTSLIVAGRVGHLDESTLALRPDEVRAVLRGGGGSPVEPGLIDQAVDMAGGWPLATAQLAAALRGGEDDPVSLAEVQERLIDHLVSEVLESLTDEQVDILELASLVRRFKPELLHHLDGDADVMHHLHELRSASCFVQVCDSPGWMRIHPLMRAAVRQRAGRMDRHRRDRLVVAAGDWFVAHREPVEAAWCRRDLADWTGSGEILVSHLSIILRTDRLDELLEITSELPLHLQAENVTWALGIAWLEICTGRVSEGLARLEMLERYCDRPQRRSLLNLRAASAPFRHDPEAALIAAEQVIDLCAESDPDEVFAEVFLVMRPSHYEAQARANALVAGAHLGAWERVRHHDVALDASMAAELSPTTTYGILGRRAAYLTLAGADRDALELLDAARVLRTTRSDLVVTAQALADLAEAAALLGAGEPERARAVVDGLPSLPDRAPNRRAWLGALRAELACEAGEPDRALDHVEDAYDDLQVTPAPMLDSLLAGATARARLALHDPAGALAALRGGADTYVTRWWRVLALLTRGDLAAAATRLDEWPDEPVPGSRVRRLLGRATLLDLQGTPGDADRTVAEAVELVERHRLVQPLRDLGALGRAMLRRVSADSPTMAELSRRGVGSGVGTDGLTQAEARIMDHLVQQLTIREIAERLHLSANTVKTHLRRIYRKLGVGDRSAAVQRWSRGPAGPVSHPPEPPDH